MIRISFFKTRIWLVEGRSFFSEKGFVNRALCLEDSPGKFWESGRLEADLGERVFGNNQ